MPENIDTVKAFFTIDIDTVKAFFTIVLGAAIGAFLFYLYATILRPRLSIAGGSHEEERAKCIVHVKDGKALTPIGAKLLGVPWNPSKI